MSFCLWILKCLDGLLDNGIEGIFCCHNIRGIIKLCNGGLFHIGFKQYA